jgi:hypothetical protein
MTIRSRTFKMKTGHVSKATLDGESTIQNWTVQTDQGAVLWLEPEWETTQLPERASNKMLNGKLVRNGFLTGQFVFAYWTHDMLEYIISTFFASGVESKEATFLYVNDENEVQYIQCEIERPRQRTQTMTAQFGGWSNVILKFTNGTDIT